MKKPSPAETPGFLILRDRTEPEPTRQRPGLSHARLPFAGISAASAGQAVDVANIAVNARRQFGDMFH